VIDKNWVDTKKAAEISGYRRAYIRQLANEGRIEAEKIADVWVINRESLLHYQENVRPGRPRKEEAADA